MWKVWEHSQAVSRGESMAFARELAGHGSSDVPGSVGSSSVGVPGAAASAALAPPPGFPWKLAGKASFKPLALVQEEQFSTAYVSSM